MLAVMYTINKDASGVILVCLDCPHTERVNEFDDRLGSRRTQAAGTMLKHARNEHGKESIGLSDHPKPANEYSPENRPTRTASGTLTPAEAYRLRGHGQCLERREETTSLSSGTAGLVAAAHPASDQNPSRNCQRLLESGGDCGASAQWLGAVRIKTGQRSDHRLRCGKTNYSGGSRCPKPQAQPQPRKPFYEGKSKSNLKTPKRERGD